MKRWKLYYPGSYTIEASIIIPVVILIIVAIIYSCFYLHDNLNMKAAMYSYVIKNYRRDTNEELSGEINEYLDSKLIITCSKLSNYEVDSEGIKIEYVYNHDFPFKWLIKILSGQYEIKSNIIEVSNLRKSDFLRKYKIAYDLKNIKAVENGN